MLSYSLTDKTIYRDYVYLISHNEDKFKLQKVTWIVDGRAVRFSATYYYLN